MKNVSKISLLTLIILLASITVIYSTNGTDSLRIDEHYQIQSTNIDDETYLVLIWTDRSLFPEYIDQFEFEAGDEFIVTSRKGDFTGTWSAVDLINFTYFTAKVEPAETTTTTTASTAIQRSVVHHQLERVEETNFLINVWGFVITLPPPLDSLGSMIGSGAYLGADVFFLGFTTREVEKEEFGSVTPDSAKQGDKNVRLTITGKNTKFEEGNTDVSFIPQAGIDVKSVDVDDDTELACIIDIDNEAEKGKRSITVKYPTGSVTGDNVFEIIERTETTTTTTPESSY